RRDPAALAAEHQHVIIAVAHLVEERRRVGRESKEAPPSEARAAGAPGRMHANARELVIVEAGALQLPVVHRIAEGLDEVQARAGVGREPDYIAAVRRDLGVHEDDVNHGGVLATIQFTTRSAPERLSVRAISSSVAPVVMT